MTSDKYINLFNKWAKKGLASRDYADLLSDGGFYCAPSSLQKNKYGIYVIKCDNFTQQHADLWQKFSGVKYQEYYKNKKIIYGKSQECQI